MKLADAIIWWNDSDAQFHLDPAREQIKILDYRAGGHDQFDYLENSNGACCGGWESMGDRRRAASLLAMVFDAIVNDGVPPAEAERELMLIDEYRDYRKNFEGPFAAVYRGDSAD